ncbi:hypothetical protein NECID01_1216 [Nematocida sp. AWRm77]|nr:hypothetical protein NECID01_1216 [Nematocida sp. AWRm77]
MHLEKFVRKEEKSTEECQAPEKPCLSEWILEEDAKTFLVCTPGKPLLPISNICNVTQTQVGKKMYGFNNAKVCVIYNADFEMVQFFKLPRILPESLIYYGEGLFAALSTSRDEVVSFKVGGKGADSEFLIGKYAVCSRVEDPLRVWSTKEGLYVQHSKGITFLKPV